MVAVTVGTAGVELDANVGEKAEGTISRRAFTEINSTNVGDRFSGRGRRDFRGRRAADKGESR